MAFSADINSFRKKVINRSMAVIKDSTATMVNDIQLPAAKGGRLSVDTGFLRSSISSALNGEPQGAPGRRGRGDGQITAVIATLIKAKPGDTISIRWLANYAVFHNNLTGFVSIPVMRWPNYIKLSNQKAANV